VRTRGARTRSSVTARYFSDQTVGDAKEKERIFRNFFGNAKATLRADWLLRPVGWADRAADEALWAALEAAQGACHAAICDNFDTKTAISALVKVGSSDNDDSCFIREWTLY
jgi:cysteinyl-tRNA synthetase